MRSSELKTLYFVLQTGGDTSHLLAIYFFFFGFFMRFIMCSSFFLPGSIS